MARYFTLEEANQIVEKVRPLVKEVLEIRQMVLARRPELIPVLEKIGKNGGNRSASELVGEFNRLEELAHQIQATGAEIKDINMGLIDFLSLREQREVYLCWQYGEDRIAFWHDLDAGYIGRQPI